MVQSATDSAAWTDAQAWSVASELDEASKRGLGGGENLVRWETPRLCRGGIRSLTHTGVSIAETWGVASEFNEESWGGMGGGAGVAGARKIDSERFNFLRRFHAQLCTLPT